MRAGARAFRVLLLLLLVLFLATGGAVAREIIVDDDDASAGGLEPFAAAPAEEEDARVSMPGGVSAPLPSSSHDAYREDALAAVEHLNAMQLDGAKVSPRYALRDIIEVRSQVVAGTMVHLKIAVGTEDDEGEPRAAARKTCDANVWRKLDGTREVTSATCENCDPRDA